MGTPIPHPGYWNMIASTFARALILGMGFLHPLWFTFKVVKSENSSQELKDRLLAFWIVNAVFTFVESICDVFVFWLPLYYEAKVLLVWWLVSCEFKGAGKVFNDYLKPILVQNEDRIDGAILQTKTVATQQISKATSMGVDFAKKK